MSSLYTIDQMKWLSDRLEEDEFTPSQVTLLGQGGRLRMVKKYLDGEADIVLKPKPILAQRSYLRLISGGTKLTVPACFGNRTIAKANGVFRGHIDRDFVDYGLDVVGVATTDTDVEVHELVRQESFYDIYNSVSVDLDKLVLTQDQVISFVEIHRNWLRSDGYGTFFLLREGNEFFVVRVVYGHFRVHVHRLSHARPWYGVYGCRIVLPQLKPASK